MAKLSSPAVAHSSHKENASKRTEKVTNNNHGGAVRVTPQPREAEMRRCVGIWMNDGDRRSTKDPDVSRCPVNITLTNHRLLLQAQRNRVATHQPPVEVALSEIAKVKNPPTGFLATIKGKQLPTNAKSSLIIKMKDEATKFVVTFVQQSNSIYTPEQDRDELARLINEYIKIHNPPDVAESRNIKTKKK